MSNTPAALEDRGVEGSEAGRPRMNRRQAAKVRTRQKVLDAARALFSERGYEPATIRDIAKGAGMSTGAVFANFQDKAELFEAVFADELAGQLEAFRTGAAIDGSTRERLVGALSAGYHQILDQLPLMQAVVARSWFQPVASDKRSRAFITPILGVLREVLQAGVASGELRQDLDVATLSRMIWDVYLSNFRKAAYDDWGLAELEPHVGTQIDLLLGSALAK